MKFCQQGSNVDRQVFGILMGNGVNRHLVLSLPPQNKTATVLKQNKKKVRRSMTFQRSSIESISAPIILRNPGSLDNDLRGRSTRTVLITDIFDISGVIPIALRMVVFNHSIVSELPYHSVKEDLSQLRAEHI